MSTRRPTPPSTGGPPEPPTDWQQQLALVLDSLDALVYIADIDTHEILFVNRYGREVFGDISGRLCWQALQQGQTGPCPSGTNDRIVSPDGTPTGLYQWEFQNPVTGRWYECRDKAIRWSDGRLARMEVATDITERKLTEQALSALAGDLAALDGNAFFEGASRRLSELLGLDYVFVGQLNAAGDGVELLAGWGAGAPMAPLSYALEGTPCANVNKHGSALHCRAVQQLFPRDRLLAEMDIESYVGSTLFDGRRRPLGILVGLGCRPIREERFACRLLDLFVNRLSAELQRAQAEGQLRQSASVFEHANEGIMITDADGTILDVNHAFTSITGYARDDVIGANPRILKSGRHDRCFYEAMWARLAETGRWSAEVWNRRKDGALYAAKQTVSAVYDDSGAVCRYVSLFSDITALKEHQQRLEHIAHYDSLTNLPNRALLAERLRQAMVEASRHGRLLGVAYLDLDGFKEVNDRHGHSRGDQLLTHLAARMHHALREEDTLARLGGDEFVAVLTDLPGRDAVAPVLQRLLAAAAAPVEVEGKSLRVSASLGVVFYPQAEPVAADQLMRQADQAMYAAKLAGKNRYRVFDAEHDQALRGRYEALGRLRRALAAEELLLHYQPKVDMRSGAVVGAEALIRWQHPERGLLPPGDFLPSVANQELAIEIGAWVLETAATQVERWQALGLHIPVSVNIDGPHFADPGFMAGLRACLGRHPGVRPGQLELEVLETSALEDIDRASAVATACEEIGVGLALDDFGTGYSTLTHLKRLPARILKIDRSFVRDMLDDPEDLAILEGVIGLADAFRRETIAEGVESAAHGAMLLSLGCRLGQGHGIARPMPAEALPAWMERWRPDPGWSNRPRVGGDQLPVLFSIVEHRAWVESLRACLNGDRGSPPHPHECRFGRWLDGGGRELYAHHPSMPRIDKVHSEIHRSAEALVGRGRRTDTEGHSLAAVEALRDELTRALDELIAPPGNAAPHA